MHLVDPEINLLEAVRFFLEPLTMEHAGLQYPARSTHRHDQVTHPTRMLLSPVESEKSIVFYTKSKRTERRIKEWQRSCWPNGLGLSCSAAMITRSVSSGKPITILRMLLLPCTDMMLPLLTLARKVTKLPSSQRRGCRSRSSRSRDASSPSCQPCSCRPHPSQLRPWFRDRQPYERVSLRAPWAPVARTVSVRCKPDKWQLGKPLAGNGLALFFSFICIYFS